MSCGWLSSESLELGPADVPRVGMVRGRVVGKESAGRHQTSFTHNDAYQQQHHIDIVVETAGNNDERQATDFARGSVANCTERGTQSSSQDITRATRA